ncbi:MAG: TetR/AcrR family transcriptional regulator [Myxococcota bacterium]|nr:TetR/AcrR family transcriptional regulator [Myxococcota bacterium]
MGRVPGARNADYDATRDAMLRRMRARLLAPDGARASFRELAEAAGVGPATLRHYFGTREGAVRAALAQMHEDGMPYLLRVTAPPSAPLRESLGELLAMVMLGLRSGVGAIHALGLSAGLRDEALGPAYLEHVLEPTQQAFEARLAHHAARGELREGADLRLAALQLIAPVLLASLHQRELGGAECRPLDVDAALTPHLEAWIRAWAREAPTTRRR